MYSELLFRWQKPSGDQKECIDRGLWEAGPFQSFSKSRPISIAAAWLRQVCFGPMRAVCLKHVPFEGPGALATALTSRGVSLERYLVPKDGLPKDSGDLLIVMGGPMSVNDPDPWIAEETSFIRSVLLAGKPVIGVCLGSQFMAKSLGATIRSGKALEIGMTQVRLTDEGRRDPVFGSCPETFDVFEWHGEVFDLPKDAVPLAGSEIAPLQAFRYGTRAYGLLFHLEMDETGIDSLCHECAADLTKARLTGQQVKSMALPHLPKLHLVADRLIHYLLAS
jgi:GMP synthase (glutamine-hydrolysing)